MKNQYELWTDEEVEDEMTLLQLEWKRRQKKSKAKTVRVTINGITAKDIAVFYAPLDPSDTSGEMNFSFYVKYKGKMYDIYYDHSKKGVFHPWWPIKDEEDEKWDQNGAFDFIPNGFSEACENCYEYNGTVKQAIAQLKEHDITDVREGNPHDIGKTGYGEGDGIKLS